MKWLVLASLALASCASGIELKKMPVEPGTDVPGLFTIIFSGRQYEEEVDALVVMDLEGDRYRFLSKAQSKDYEILRSITIDEALYEAEPFFRLHLAYSGRKTLYRILDPNGQTIGYELRPLYFKDYVGVEDLLKSKYMLKKDGNVEFSAREMSITEIMMKR